MSILQRIFGNHRRQCHHRFGIFLISIIQFSIGNCFCDVLLVSLLNPIFKGLSTVSRAVIHLEDGGERNKYSLLVEGDNLRLDTYSITSGFFGIILGNYVILD